MLAELERNRETLKEELTQVSIDKLRDEQERAIRLVTRSESLVVDLNMETGYLATEIARRSQFIGSKGR